ncbi:MAG: hypothetical protein OEZ43_17830 [Gammaproteobacteria bacterium]|nr:hypothetical protein [Gammaproteobacteria bacterium]
MRRISLFFLLITPLFGSVSAADYSTYFSIGRGVWAQQPSYRIIYDNIQIQVNPLTGLEEAVRGSGVLEHEPLDLANRNHIEIGIDIPSDLLSGFVYELSFAANFWYQPTGKTVISEDTTLITGYTWHEYPLTIGLRYTGLPNATSLAAGVSKHWSSFHSVYSNLNTSNVLSLSVDARTRLVRDLYAEVVYSRNRSPRHAAYSYEYRR